jgi:polyhydroxybutyrate depolymerase
VSTGPGNHRLEMEFGGQKRTYLLHAPPGYTRSARLPLVVALHFYPGDGASLQEMIEFDAKADKENFLVAYPDGYGLGFNALICCGSQDDVGFIKALVKQTVSTWNADPGKVYATGISNGGDMSFRLAVEASDTFAAIGVVSGGFIGPMTSKPDFAPKRPVSVVTVVGDADLYFGQIDAGIKTWRERLKCSQTAAESAATYTRTASRCADGSDIDVYVVREMGHLWPGATKGNMAAPNAGIVATDVVWAFFAAHSR